MNTHYIFQKAMSSTNPHAILEVGRIFERMGAYDFAMPLYQRVHNFAFSFGAMARGTPIAGTNGAVIPPGRYWIDLVDDNKRKAWTNWTIYKPEIKVEKSDWEAGDPQHVVQTVIFVIPSTATNYGMPGVLFPTQVLGFPTIADTVVQKQADTVQRPPPMTYTDAAREVMSTSSQALGSVAQGVGTLASDVGKGLGQGLGLSTTKMALLGAGLLVGLFFLNRMMPIPKL